MADRRWSFERWRACWRRRADLAPAARALADAIQAGDRASEVAARRALLNAYGIWREVANGRFPGRDAGPGG